jgi:hypothetical protein
MIRNLTISKMRCIKIILRQNCYSSNNSDSDKQKDRERYLSAKQGNISDNGAQYISDEAV